MSIEQQTRALLAPADPARDRPVPTPVLSAQDLIARAGQQEDDVRRRAPRVGRRLVLASGAAVLAATAVAAVERHDRAAPRPATRGVVVQPIAYSIPDSPPPAAKYLRDLADRIGDAPWDAMTGPYTYHHVQEWGTFAVGSADGRFLKSAVDDRYTWFADDRDGRWVLRVLPPQYRDEASRAYFEDQQDILDGRSGGAGAEGPVHLPSLPAAVATAFRAGDQIGVPERLTKLYQDYAIPRAARADLLRRAAGQPDFAWRGPVVDRAGRAGLAVTRRLPDVPGYQDLLIFDPGTGALLAREITTTQGGRTYVGKYVLILQTALTTTTR
ncbi:hypothetical protein ACWKSP_02085 [Micromonosporaceae bacterium Da 78-11]